jgi:membrane protein
MMQYLRKRLLAIYQGMQGLSGGRMEVISHSVNRFIAMQGLETAATLAYYALFSLFPTILVLGAILSYLLESSDEAYIQTVLFFGNALPVTFTLVRENLRELLDVRRQLGVIGLIAALWSASSFFTTLARSVNRAWPSVRLRNVVQNRLIGLAMVGALFLLLLFSLLSSAFVNLLPSMFEVMGGSQIALLSPLLRLVLRWVPGIFSFFMFVALYRWVPNCAVRWSAVFKGAAVTAIAWESAKFIFGYYLSSGLVNYEYLYGSLGTIMALMFWIYLSSLIALFGAYLVATLDLRADEAEKMETAQVETTSQAAGQKECWIESEQPVALQTPALNRVEKVDRKENRSS